MNRYAKAPRPDGKQTTIKEHLTDVRNLARAYGEPLGLSDSAGLAGGFHDVGKYSDRFAKVLRGEATRVDHAICGAALLRASRKSSAYLPVIEAIAGHHAGLFDCGKLDAYLEATLREEKPIECPSGKVAALAGVAEYQAASAAWRADFPDFTLPKLAAPAAQDAVAAMLETRMLFSCLVDADYTASAMEEGEEIAPPPAPLDPQALLAALYQYRDVIRAGSKAESALNHLRDELFDLCGRMGETDRGLYTLTAPTGTGKTLALLHFALRHCLATGRRRIIVVLPFLSLAEQNAQIYQDIVSTVLIDHSMSDLDERARALAQRWDAPFILTTSVKFFESLFERKPVDCRKLHNIAGSVVIFDEAQSLPPEVTAATLEAVRALCGRYRCTMVFSTATQPAFGALPGMDWWKPVEILRGGERFYDMLRRTRVAWRLGAPVSFAQIAREMAGERCACAIVNLRRHAAKLYESLLEASPEGETFFLSANLCPAHRGAVINRIKARLGNDKNLPCRLVSTQCIEAGVDLDFETMYRALAPLDAIIQAAGRCNRNGKQAQGGRVVVFIPDEAGNLYPGNWYARASATVLEMSDQHAIDIHAPAHIAAYYARIFSGAADKRELRLALRARDYEGVDRHYRLIASQGARLLVPYAQERKNYEDLRAQGLREGVTARWMRETALLTVSVYDRAALAQVAEELPFAGSNGEGSGFYVLRAQYEDLYRADTGLRLDGRTIDAAEFLI